MIRLSIPITAGPLTCAEHRGRFCRFMRARIDGSNPTCALFGAALSDEDGDIYGWLLRCPECIEAEHSEPVVEYPHV